MKINLKFPKVNLVKTSKVSIPLLPVTLFLLVLKLVGVNISWFWVFFPIMLPIFFVMLILMVFVLILLCAIFVAICEAAGR